MNKFERDELGTLVLRYVATAVEEALALVDNPPDMGRWVTTADAATEARREFWEALLRLDIKEPPQKLSMAGTPLEKP